MVEFLDAGAKFGPESAGPTWPSKFAPWHIAQLCVYTPAPAVSWAWVNKAGGVAAPACAAANSSPAIANPVVFNFVIAFLSRLGVRNMIGYLPRSLVEIEHPRANLRHLRRQGKLWF